MRKSEPFIAIISTNYNGASTIYKSKNILWHMLNSISKTSYGNFRIIIGDDSSTDGSISFIKKNFPEVEIVLNKPENRSYTKNSNNAIRYTLKKYDPDYIALLNNDIIIKDKDWLSKLLAVAQSGKKIGIVGCKYLYPDGRLQHAGVSSTGIMIRCRGWNTNDANKYNEIEEIPAVGFATAIIKREVIDRVGLLDENFYMGSDDADYCEMARRKGFKIMYDGQVSVIHLEGFTAKKISSNKDPDFWFPIFQVNYMYAAFKRFDSINRIGAIGFALASSIISIGNRQVKLGNLRIKSRPIWRLKETLNAIIIGYKLHKKWISSTEAYSQYLIGKQGENGLENKKPKNLG